MNAADKVTYFFCAVDIFPNDFGKKAYFIGGFLVPFWYKMEKAVPLYRYIMWQVGNLVFG